MDFPADICVPNFLQAGPSTYWYCMLWYLLSALNNKISCPRRSNPRSPPFTVIMLQVTEQMSIQDHLCCSINCPATQHAHTFLYPRLLYSNQYAYPWLMYSFCAVSATETLLSSRTMVLVSSRVLPPVNDEGVTSALCQSGLSSTLLSKHIHFYKQQHCSHKKHINV